MVPALVYLVIAGVSVLVSSCNDADHFDLGGSKTDDDSLKADDDGIIADDEPVDEDSIVSDEDSIVTDDAGEGHSTLVGSLPESPKGYYRSGNSHWAFTDSKVMKWSGAGDATELDLSKIDGKDASIVGMEPMGNDQLVHLQVEGYPGFAKVDGVSVKPVRAEVRMDEADNAISGITSGVMLGGVLCLAANMGEHGPVVACMKLWPAKAIKDHEGEEICAAKVSDIPSAMMVNEESIVMLMGDKVATMPASLDGICASSEDDVVEPSIDLGGVPTMAKILPLGDEGAAVVVGSQLVMVDLASESVKKVDTGAPIKDMAVKGSTAYALHSDGELIAVAESGDESACDTQISSAGFVAADVGELFVTSGAMIYSVDVDSCAN